MLKNKMDNRGLLKLKLGFAIASFGFLLTGSKLLFVHWTSIHWTIWVFATSIVYRGVYLTIKNLLDKSKQVEFKGFATIEAATWVVAISITTVILLIFYPLISLLFYGLTFISLFVYGGIEFK